MPTSTESDRLLARQLNALLVRIDEDQKKTKKRPKTHKAVEVVRYFVTGGAMVPQGGFGGLESLRFAKNEFSITNKVAQLTLFGGTSFCAAEGKRQLVMLFNKDDFHKIADLERKDLHPRKWTLFGVVNGAFTVVASSTFGFLAKASCEEVVKLLLEYNFPATDFAANIIATPYFQYPFVVFATGANLVGFPSIHRNAWNAVKGFGNYYLERPKYRRFIDKLERRAAGVRREWRDTIKNDVTICPTHLLVRQLISTHFDNELSVDLFDNLTIAQKTMLINAIDKKKLAQSLFMRKYDGHCEPQTLTQTYQGKTITPETWAEFLPKHAVGSLFTWVGFRGFINFIDITKDGAERLHIPSKVGSVLGVMDYISMCALALISIYFLNAIVSFAFGRDRAPTFITKLTLGFCILYTLFVVGIGGTPITEQSWYANQRSLPDLTYAFSSSALCEFNGMLLNITLFFLNRALAKDENKMLAKAVDGKLTDAINSIKGMKPEKLEELADEDVPQQYPNCLFFGRKNPYDEERGSLLPRVSQRGTVADFEGSGLRVSRRHAGVNDDIAARSHGKGEVGDGSGKKPKRCTIV